MIDAIAGRLRRRAPARGTARVSGITRPNTTRARRIMALVIVAALLAGAWLWLRDSSLVAVKRVTVLGVSGPDAAQVRSALILAARDMTTLDVSPDDLRSAVAQFPVVKDLQVSTQFPHGMRIRVIEQVPVGVVVVAGRRISVAGDGTLLHDVPPAPNLPTIPVRVPPGGARVSPGDGRDEVAVLAAAPYPLLVRVNEISRSGPHGLVLQMRGGPSIYFGDASELTAKWAAVSGVLADPGSAGAYYIDVTDPRRPAAGTEQTAAAAQAGASQGGATSRTSSRSGSGSPAVSSAQSTGSQATSAAGATGYAPSPGSP